MEIIAMCSDCRRKEVTAYLVDNLQGMQMWKPGIIGLKNGVTQNMAEGVYLPNCVAWALIETEEVTKLYVSHSCKTNINTGNQTKDFILNKIMYLLQTL